MRPEEIYNSAELYFNSIVKNEGYNNVKIRHNKFNKCYIEEILITKTGGFEERNFMINFSTKLIIKYLENPHSILDYKRVNNRLGWLVDFKTKKRDEVIKIVILHELAHYLSYKVAYEKNYKRIKPHGELFLKCYKTLLKKYFNKKTQAKSKIKILNLYSGIGGNRKFWGDNYDITALENDPKIAKIYKDFFPNDRVITEDAHDYLLKHYKEYDIIWASPPCQSHSRIRFALGVNSKDRCITEPLYPDMKLWQEIIFLKSHFKGLWVVENVIPYYKNLINPTIRLNRHYYWSNFGIYQGVFKEYFGSETKVGLDELQDKVGFDLSKYKYINKIQVLRNCVNPQAGLHILKCALYSKNKNVNLFNYQERISLDMGDINI